MAAEKTKFNILEHELVPEHVLLTEEEAEQVLSELGITRDQLPKIGKYDPAIRQLEKTLVDGSGSTYGVINPGRVIKVIRKSATAEEFVAYRVVVAGGELQ